MDFARLLKQAPVITEISYMDALGKEQLLISRLLNLSGYGYAKVPLAVKQRWKQHIEDYFEHRQSLKGLVLPVDVRHPLTSLDEQMLRYCLAGGLPTLVLLTKADKPTRNHPNQAMFKLKKQLSGLHWEGLSYTLQLFSSVTGQGEKPARAQVQCRLGL